MRVLVDLTNSPHVPFFAPLVRRMQARGDEVVITARRFAQTVELSALHGLDVHVIGAHGGGTTVGKARAAAGRTWGLWRYARGLHRSSPIDVALSHGSTDLPWVAARLDVPHVTIFDYEYAKLQHGRNVPRSWRVVTPDAIPAERLDAYGAAGKLAQYPGLKEEYYLADADLAPHPGGSTLRAELGIDANAVLAVLRPPPELALYHRGHVNELFGAALALLAGDPSARVVVLPRTDEQAVAVRASYAGNDRVIVPEHAVDAQRLLVESDLVISAGGTMNREAVALGLPVWTTFAGTIGAVDEQLLAEERLRQLSRIEDLVIEPRPDRGAGLDAVRARLRDPDDLLDLLLEGLPVAAG
jgi:predicted glycosyltransferase